MSNRDRWCRSRLMASTAMVGATLLALDQGAEAACVVTAPPNVFTCSGANTTGQVVPATVTLPIVYDNLSNLIGLPADPTVSTDPGFSVNTGDQYALAILGAGAVSYTDGNSSPLTSSSSVGLGVVSLVLVSADRPVYGPNPGGAVAVDTNGAVTGVRTGLAALNAGDGAR